MPIWKPHPRQEEALKRIEYEILYGGARGGGKTDAGLVWLTDYIENPQYRALVIRKNADDLSDWVGRAVKFYTGLGAKIGYRPAIIKFPSGAEIRTGHLKDDQAYTKYQGHEYQRMLIEELTQIPDERRYLQLLGSCRSTVSDIKAQVFATTNPGGVGHIWVKKRFVDPAPPNTPFKDKTSGRTRIYIPARVDDNPTLMKADPDYVQYLEGLKDTDNELWKAWRMGDWSTFAGQYFREFNPDIHAVNSFIPDKSKVQMIIGGLDWGRAAPFSCHFTAIQVKKANGVVYHRAYTFAEIYGTEKTPKEWGHEIMKELEHFNLTLDDIRFIQADNQIFTKGLDMSKSIADQFADANQEFRYKLQPGSKDRIGGWENLHNWLSLAPDGLPYWMITRNCHNLIRTLPELIHDEVKVEDVDTHGEDHAADDQRYQFKAIKWIDAKVGPAWIKGSKPILPHTVKTDPQTSKEIGLDLKLFEKQERR